ncbi:hypothetical protein Salat_0213500 [Sesamum alatum]|uniref:Uncharacterized protein n=1 Tax=Sesamum alatum TaxID=300844 RepID=A0AAE1YYS8_9LAMI|nr:hypothetical protein Salat_0213500 [Sesamum alatum]
MIKVLFQLATLIIYQICSSVYGPFGKWEFLGYMRASQVIILDSYSVQTLVKIDGGSSGEQRARCLVLRRLTTAKIFGGEENAELLLETLFAYSEYQQPKTEIFCDGLFSRNSDDLAENLHQIEAFHKSDSSDPLNSLFGEDTNKSSYGDSGFHLKEVPSIFCQIWFIQM